MHLNGRLALGGRVRLARLATAIIGRIREQRAADPALGPGRGWCACRSHARRAPAAARLPGNIASCLAPSLFGEAASGGGVASQGSDGDGVVQDAAAAQPASSNHSCPLSLRVHARRRVPKPRQPPPSELPAPPPVPRTQATRGRGRESKFSDVRGCEGGGEPSPARTDAAGPDRRRRIAPPFSGESPPCRPGRPRSSASLPRPACSSLLRPAGRAAPPSSALQAGLLLLS